MKQYLREIDISLISLTLFYVVLLSFNLSLLGQSLGRDFERNYII